MKKSLNLESACLNAEVQETIQAASGWCTLCAACVICGLNVALASGASFSSFA